MSAVSVELEYGCPKVCVRVRIGVRSGELPEGGLDFAIANPVHKFEVRLERVELVSPCLEQELEAGHVSASLAHKGKAATHSSQDSFLSSRSWAIFRSVRWLPSIVA